MALELEIVTPEKKVYSKKVDDVVLPTKGGEVDLLGGHVPLISIIDPGEIKVTTGGSQESLAVDKGFARVQGDVVSILTEAAINVEDIDLSQVEEAKKRAEEALKQAESENWDVAEVERLQSVARFAVIQQLVKNKRK